VRVLVKHTLRSSAPWGLVCGALSERHTPPVGQSETEARLSQNGPRAAVNPIAPGQPLPRHLLSTLGPFWGQQSNAKKTHFIAIRLFSSVFVTSFFPRP
jgi:hypothetical protein